MSTCFVSTVRGHKEVDERMRSMHAVFLPWATRGTLRGAGHVSLHKKKTREIQKQERAHHPV